MTYLVKFIKEENGISTFNVKGRDDINQYCLGDDYRIKNGELIGSFCEQEQEAVKRALKNFLID